MGWGIKTPVEKFVLNKEEYTPEKWDILCQLFGGDSITSEVMIINIDSIEIFDELN